MSKVNLFQQPSPGSCILAVAGETVEFTLEVPGRRRGSAFLRTNINRAAIRRREVIEHTDSGRPFAAADWYDLEMTAVGNGRYSICLPLAEIGFFYAKAFFLPEGSTSPMWPDGENTAVKVMSAATASGNSVYTAFTRQFRDDSAAHSEKAGDASIRNFEDLGYAVIPPSGTFREIIRRLDHIMGGLGFRILQLLPIHPVPTTYARMGRFGSPFASRDFYDVDHAYAEFDERTTPLEQFCELVDAVHARGGRIFLDIPANHTGWASAFQTKHPEWFKRNQNGTFKSPGAWGVTWADLVELDYENPDLRAEMANVFLFWCAKGVDGFRCDAGYMIPSATWEYITARIREVFPNTVFMLEGLGGKQETTDKLLREANLDWAYSEIFQYDNRDAVSWYLSGAIPRSESFGPLISFAETHDNNRLAARGQRFASMRTALCALLSQQGAYGITAGVEWFCRDKIDVHGAPPLNWGSQENQVAFISRLNKVIASHHAFFSGASVKLVQTSCSNSIAAVRTFKALPANQCSMCNVQCTISTPHSNSSFPVRGRVGTPLPADAQNACNEPRASDNRQTLRGGQRSALPTTRSTCNQCGRAVCPHTAAEMVHHEPSKLQALSSKLLILANLDAENPSRVEWRSADFDADEVYDLLTGARIEIGHISGDCRFADLPQGAVYALTSNPEDIARLRNDSDCEFGNGQSANDHFARNSAALSALRDLSALDLFESKYGLNPDAVGVAFAADPVEFCAVNGDMPRCSVWQGPQDARRTVMVPPGFLLCVKNKNPFRALVYEGDKPFCSADGVRLADGTYAALLKVPQVTVAVETVLEVASYDGNNTRRTKSPVLLLTEAEKASFSPILDGPRVRKGNDCAVLANRRGAMAQVRAAFGDIRSQYDAFLAINRGANYPDNRMVFFTRCRAWLNNTGYSFALDSSNLESFTVETGCRSCAWRFSTPAGMGKEAIIVFRLVIAENSNRVDFQIARDKADSDKKLVDNCPVTIILRPDIEARDFHCKTLAGGGDEMLFSKAVKPTASGFDFVTDRMAPCRMTLGGGKFHGEPEWSYSVPHEEEARRGLGTCGDLFSPGWFEVELRGGEVKNLVAGVTSELAVDEPPKMADAIVTSTSNTLLPGRRIGGTPIASRLTLGDWFDSNPISLFIADRESLKTVIAGYPWFLDWGRDTLIVLRGMLAAGMTDDVLAVLQKFGHFEDHGTLPNIILGENAGNRDTSDAPLWYIVAAGEVIEQLNNSLELRAKSLEDQRTEKGVCGRVGTPLPADAQNACNKSRATDNRQALRGGQRSALPTDHTTCNQCGRAVCPHTAAEMEHHELSKLQALSSKLLATSPSRHLTSSNSALTFFRDVIISIVTGYINGTANGIHVDPESGLVFSPSHFTWMDTNYPAGTPRCGYPVEIQVLWIKALSILREKLSVTTFTELELKARESLYTLYSMPDGWLADSLRAENGTPAKKAIPEDALRPNQLLAVSLGVVPAGSAMAKAIVRACEKLIIPGGIRSLADAPVSVPQPVHGQFGLLNDPMNPYWGHYEGDEDTRRKPAYHNGTAWGWQFPVYCEAYAAAYGKDAAKTALALLASVAPLLESGCICSLPEIFDGDIPHTQRGCLAQAWSVSEALRVWKKLRA